MKSDHPSRVVWLASLLSVLLFAGQSLADPLPSWNNTATKQAIIAFVDKVTTPGSPDYVVPAGRIATFDNDGTLWAEKPLYFQALFALDRVRELAPQHPDWKNTEPYASVIKGDFARAMKADKKQILQMLLTSHADITSEQFEQIVLDWLAAARHPTTGKPFTQMVYQPMLELLAYLRANDFQTFIVSGGGIEFMRPWVGKVYGVPPQQVVGSSVKTRYEMQDGKPVIFRLPEINFVDDKAGKPLGINSHIGQRPIFAAGNSDGDFEMLQWTTTADGPRFGLLIHHTDAKREWAYDRDSLVGRLDKALDAAPQYGWSVMNMKDDWKIIWPDEATADAVETQSLVGNWLIEDIDGKGVVDRARTTLKFADDGAVSGQGGVNQYHGQARIDGPSLSFGPLASTRKAGPPALMDQEAKFHQALTQVKGYRFDETGRLLLIDAQGDPVLRCTRITDK